MLIVKEDIISRINNGDAKAFEQLYTTFYVYLCAVATKYVYNSEAAREIVNDVFMNVWNHHSALIHPVNAYLIRSVRNYCLNYLRDKRQQEVPLSDVQESLLSIQELQIDADPHPLAYLENKEFEEKIYRAVDSLPAKCRDIFVQYLYHNKTYEEIAITNYRNVGSVKNNGFEVSLGVDILKGGDWNWSVAANLGLNRNKITELYGGKSEIITANAGTSYYIYMDKILTPGQDVDTWYGTEWAGVDPQTGAPLWYTTNEKGERITTSDYSEASKHQTILGKLSPDFYGGFSTNLSWKNIDLSAVFGYSVGGEIYNYDRSMYDSDGAYVNYNQMNLRDDWNRWEKPGDIATHPKAEYGNKSQSSKGSSRYLEDASYLRLRSLTLGYTLPWKIQYVDNVRLSFSGENLFVLSGFSGVDPELPAEVGSQYKAGSVGVAISPYPQARKFMFGLNVTF